MSELKEQERGMKRQSKSRNSILPLHEVIYRPSKCRVDGRRQDETRGVKGVEEE